MLNVIKNRYTYLAISAVLFIISIFTIFFSNYNLWIDMTGWSQIEYSYKGDINIDKEKKIINKATNWINFNWKDIINAIKVYKVSWEKKFIVVIWYNNSLFTSKSSQEEKELQQKFSNLREKIKDNITNILKKDNPSIELSKYTNIWKSFWDYIKKTAFITLAIALIFIAIYIAFAFSWSISWISSVSFAVIALVTLLHDVIISTGLYIYTWNIFPEFKIDTFFITALLTILWYSINDTIVVFDRIRENLKLFWWKKKNWKNLKEIINLSVNETLTRSIYTSLTVLFVLFTILIMWPETLGGFILTMIFWTIVWTYSSIFIASPLLYEINKNKKLEIYKEKIYNPDDKIVV